MRSFWLGLSFGAAMVAAYGLGWHTRPLQVKPAAKPARGYDEAIARLQVLKQQDGPDIRPVCQTQLLSHGAKCDRALVLLHGYTNCPRQFRLLAAHFFEQGYNILIPRLPYHGQASRKPPNLGRMTAEECVVHVNESVDIAHGLGDQVTVLGFSFGGALTGWIAQHRQDVERVILVAPAYGLKAISFWQQRFYANWLALLPDSFRWWNPELKEAAPGPEHTYAGFPTHGIATILRLGVILQTEAKHAAPAVSKIMVVTNPTDAVVNNELTMAIAGQWRGHGAPVKSYEFPASLQLDHDSVDPDQPGQQVKQAYPLLLDFLRS